MERALQPLRRGAWRPWAGERNDRHHRVDLDYLLSAGCRRTEADGGSLYVRLLEVARFLRRTSAPDFLACVLRDTPSRARLIESVTRIDHVGMVVAPAHGLGLAAAAGAAGFDRRQWTFPSRILARELGGIAGSTTVPTTVFKARGQLPHGEPMDVEIFMPSVTPPPIRAWMERGAGTHVAFAIREGVTFDEIAALMQAEGFRLPAFMRDRPLSNEAEGISALYFDPAGGGRCPRLEFCSYR